ncbi:hypothetical protein GCM10009559_56390 [Pseudonocardia zijingensis]|uniref:Uncharacterized protein n=1 Tax=Pseudonocardia zijingensis TaxID=153376 RepID=A0ABP3YMF2_9PSEU
MSDTPTAKATRSIRPPRTVGTTFTTAPTKLSTTAAALFPGSVRAYCQAGTWSGEVVARHALQRRAVAMASYRRG